MKYIEIRFCPLKGLIIMNFNDLFQFVKWEDEEPFPSPTGVNYYEYFIAFDVRDNSISFRPQQGLTIMNNSKENRHWKF